jgi:iron complex transport system permease protein
MTIAARPALPALRESVGARPGAWTALGAVALLAAALVACAVGATRIPLGELRAALLDASHPAHVALVAVRLPRVLAAIGVGSALALAGLLLQTAVRNPLADSGLLGVNAGAGVAALCAILFAPERVALLPVVAFGGALLATGAVLGASGIAESAARPLRIVLCGVALQAMLFAVAAGLTFLYADRAPSFVGFTIGSLNGVGWREVWIVSGTTLVGGVAAWLGARPLNLLLLDDDSAAGVGLPVRTTRFAAAALAAFLASGAVAVAGLVGFVGLVAPNWLRLIAAPDHRTLVPLVALLGAGLVVAADTAARTLAAPLELPVGALLAWIGGPYFLWLVARRLA